jgi:hypothetical protein
MGKEREKVPGFISWNGSLLLDSWGDINLENPISVHMK